MKKSRSVFYIAAALALLFWVLNATILSSFLPHHSFLTELLKPQPHDLAVRAMAAFLLLCGALVWLYYRRKIVQRLTADSDTRYQRLVEASPDAIIIHDGVKVYYANRTTLDLYGIEKLEDFSRKTLLSTVHPEDQVPMAERLANVLKTGEPSPLVEVKIFDAQGNIIDIMGRTARIEVDGQPALVSFIRDVSPLIQARRELETSQERLLLALDAARDGVWDWDIPTGGMIYNTSWAQMLGYQLNEIQPDHSTWLALIHPDDHARVTNRLQAHLRSEVPSYEAEVRLRHKRGHYIWVLDRGKVVERDRKGQPRRMTGTHRDITGRKEAEIALEIRNRIAEVFLTTDGQDIYASILELVCEATESHTGFFGVMSHDHRLQIKTWLPESLQALSSTDGQLSFPVDDLPALLQPIIQQQKSLIENDPPAAQWLPLSAKSLLAVPVTNGEQVFGLIFVGNRLGGYRDSEKSLVESLAGYLAPILQSHVASEMREEQLRQAQKMEALGSLAGGIAHDFNNILQAIMGFSTLAAESAPDGGIIASDLERVLRATRRGQDLVQQILLFSRREEQDRTPVNLYTVVAEAVDLVRPTIPASIALHDRLSPDTGQVVGDPAQLNQVILNLVRNSVQAMEENGGVLELDLFYQSGTEPVANLSQDLAGQDLAVLTVGDTGCGMDEETLQRLFDPFYTTKEVGKGTGLGLSMVHGIVSAHGGEIHITSQREVGTMVRVYLPRLVEAQTTIPTDDLAITDALSGYHVAFIDDEEDITIIGQAMLSKMGCTVEEFSSGPTALAAIEARPTEFDLVVSDLTMPNMSGVELAAGVASLRPDLPVVLITGASDRPGEPLADYPHIRGVIRKPFGKQELFAAVSAVLKSAQPEEVTRKNGQNPDH